MKISVRLTSTPIYPQTNALPCFVHRIKSGMPGYLVALNPTDVDVIANFTSDTIGAELSVQMLSPGFEKNPLRGKVLPSSIPLPRKSVAIFTFVPK